MYILCEYNNVSSRMIIKVGWSLGMSRWVQGKPREFLFFPSLDINIFYVPSLDFSLCFSLLIVLRNR
jgi:hypothetical protein